MLQDIHPHIFDNAFKRRVPSDNDFAVAVRGGEALFTEIEGGFGIPTVAEIAAADAGAASRLRYLFSIDDRALYLLDDAPDAMAGFHYRDVFALREFEPSWLGFAAITAWHLGSWYAKNRFCGMCGKPMAEKEDERALICAGCGHVVYPAIAPAVIVGIVDGNRIIMTRYANRPYRRMALVAGFMEIGETLEETVRREVMEEVGVRVKNIRYYQSQPWAFSGSVLVGFFCDLDGPPDITLDETELSEAIWVAREDIPPPESLMSLTSTMVEAFRNGEV